MGKRQVKKLACLVNDLNFGGSQRVMALLANEFSKNSQVDTHLILYGKDAPVVYSVANEVTVRQPTFRFDKRNRFLSTLRRLNFLRRVLRHGNYDAILSFGERWNSFVMLAALGLDQRVYLSDRSSPNVDLGLLQTGLRKLLYPMASGLIAQTRQACDLAKTLSLNSRIRVIPNPVAGRGLAPEENRENIVLSVGRVIATKNYDRLLKIFASIKIDGWKLVIVGDDSQGQSHIADLRKQVDESGLSGRVEFAGKRSDVERFYDRAKIFAFASSSEGFPNVVAEALSAGLPVVSYDCVAGPADLIKNGENGFLVDLFDDAIFVNRLSQLMTNKHQRRAMALNARQSIAHLEPSRVATNVLEFIQEDA